MQDSLEEEEEEEWSSLPALHTGQVGGQGADQRQPPPGLLRDNQGEGGQEPWGVWPPAAQQSICGKEKLLPARGQG